MNLQYLNINDNAVQLKKTYRELALVYHPDKGGNLKKMQQLNAEYDYITQSRFHQRAFEFDDMVNVPDIFKNPIVQQMIITGLRGIIRLALHRRR